MYRLVNSIKGLWIEAGFPQSWFTLWIPSSTFVPSLGTYLVLRFFFTPSLVRVGLRDYFAPNSLHPSDPKFIPSILHKNRRLGSSLMKIWKKDTSNHWNLKWPLDSSLSTKKTANIDPVKIIDIWISIRSKMPIHFPWSPISWTNWKEQNISQKLMCSRDTTMYGSEMEINGKRPSPPNLAYLNLW